MADLKKKNREWSLTSVLAVVVLAGLLGCLGCSKADRVAKHIKKGNAYFEAGELEKADIEFLNALRLDPRNRVVILRLGAIYFEQGRSLAALKFLKAGKQLAPEDLENRMRLAELLSTGQPATAREELDAILAKDPGRSAAIDVLASTAITQAEIADTRNRLRGLKERVGDQAVFHSAEGVLLLRENKAEPAKEAFKRALALDPKIPTAYSGLGSIYWQQTNLVEAERMFKAAADLSRLRSPRQLKWVEFKLKNGATKEAQQFLEQLVGKVPDYIPALNHLAELEFASRNTNQSAVHLGRVLVLDPENYEGRLLQAKMKLTEGRAADAVRDLERLKAFYPGSAQLHYLLAQSYLANRDAGKAITVLEHTLTLNSNLYEPTFLLADLKTRRGETSEAIALLSDLIKKRPKDEKALFFLATAYRAGGKPEDALSIFRRMARDFPTNPLAPLSIGAILRQQGKPAEARKAFESALQITPESQVAIRQLVELDLIEGKKDAALQRVQAAIQKNPRSAELQFIQGRVLMAKGDTAQAEAALRKCMELAPDFREPYIVLAQLYIGSKKPDLALEEFGKVLAKNPKDTGALLMMGMLQSSKGNYTKARESYEKLLAVDPKSTPALNNLAYIYAVRLKQPDKAIDLAQKARLLLADDPAMGDKLGPVVADTLGWATYLRGDYAAALPLLQESAAKLSSEPEAQYHLGMAHYMMGQEGPARIALEKAMQSADEFPGKDEARQKLVVLGGQAGLSMAELIKSLEASLAQSPNDVAVLLRLGDLYEQSGSMDKARDVAERAVKLNPKAVRALLVLARVQGARPDGAARALEYAKSARAAAPNDAEVAHAAGRATFQAGQYEWAYSILRESHTQQAGNPDAAYDFAWSAYSMGRVAEAETAMQVALRTGTNFSRADAAKLFLDLVALTRSPAGLSQASPRIQAALKGDPAYVPALMAAALAWEQQKGYAEAVKLYEQALGRYPQFLPAIRNLAILYANHVDNLPKGYELAAKARQSLPDDMELARALGKLVYRRNDYQYAARLLKEVQQKNAADAETYFYLGLSQVQLKQPAEGAASLRRALAMNLDPKLAAEANRVLAEVK